MKTEKIKKVDKLVVIKTECDRCRRELTPDTFDTYEVEISTGEYEPYEGHQSKSRTLDLCRACTGDLISILASKGFRIPDEE